MHCAHRHSRNCHAREHVASNLKEAHYERALEHASRWFTNAPSVQCAQAATSTVGAMRRSMRDRGGLLPHGEKQNAVAGNKCELDESQRDWVAKTGHDRFARVGRKGG